MKVICNKCGQEFDWNSNDIFMHPEGYTINFTCRNCLKATRIYRKGKIKIQ